MTTIRSAGARRTFQRMRRSWNQCIIGRPDGGRPEQGRPEGDRSAAANLPAASEFVDSAAYCRLVDPFAVHLLWFDLLARRIDEFVVLPERRLFLGKLDPLLHEEFSVDILRVAQVLADELFIGPVGEDDPVKLIDDDVE